MTNLNSLSQKIQWSKKIVAYLNNALQKPAYIVVMILDPTFKTIFGDTHASFIKEHFKMNLDDIIGGFLEILDEYEEDLGGP